MLNPKTLDPNSAANSFFFKNQAASVARCHGQLSSCTISEETKDTILRKLNDRRTDRRIRVISWNAV